MTFDVTWTITAIIAVSSFLSPIAVAIINNMHNSLCPYKLVDISNIDALPFSTNVSSMSPLPELTIL